MQFTQKHLLHLLEQTADLTHLFRVNCDQGQDQLKKVSAEVTVQDYVSVKKSNEPFECESELKCEVYKTPEELVRYGKELQTMSELESVLSKEPRSTSGEEEGKLSNAEKVKRLLY